MCLILGLYIWHKHGGRLIIIFQPFPHCVVFCKDGICRHGTNRGKGGRWKIQEMEMESFRRWFFREERRYETR